MKKLLTSLIVLLLLVGCCLIAAFPTSASDINYDDWDIIDGVIIEYIGAGGDVVVPSVDADGNPITHIDSRAFRSNTDITSVVISEGIETMGSEVFEYCENLTEATLPWSLTETGISIFRRCNLYALTIPGQLKILKNDFSVGGPITDFVISHGVEEIASDAIYGHFTELVLPESVYLVKAHFRGGMAHTVKEWRLTILNPECELGVSDGKDEYFEKFGSVGPLTTGYDGCACKIVVQGLKDSPIKEYVNTYMKDKDYMGKVTTRFVGLEQDELDKIDEENRARSILEAPATDDGGNGDNGDNGDNGGDGGNGSNNNGSNNNGSNNNGSNNNGSNNNGNVNSDNGGNNMLLIIIIIVACFFFLIIVVVVVMVVMMNGNKKKKKKKKVAAPVEDVVEDVVTEEPGEEE